MRNALHVFALFSIITSFAFSMPAHAEDRPIDPSKLEGKITIPLGTKIIVEFEQHGRTLSHATVVRAASGKRPAVLFDFRDRGGDLYLLTIKNTFPKALRFRALARPKGQKGYFETSILPVMAGLTNFESWHEPFSELVLFDFKLTDERPK